MVAAILIVVDVVFWNNEGLGARNQRDFQGDQLYGKFEVRGGLSTLRWFQACRIVRFPYPPINALRDFDRFSLIFFFMNYELRCFLACD